MAAMQQFVAAVATASPVRLGCNTGIDVQQLRFLRSGFAPIDFIKLNACERDEGLIARSSFCQAYSVSERKNLIKIAAVQAESIADTEEISSLEAEDDELSRAGVRLLASLATKPVFEEVYSATCGPKVVSFSGPMIATTSTTRPSTIETEMEKPAPEPELEPEPERDFTGTPYIPIYVMLPLGTITHDNKVADADGLEKDFAALKAAGVDGVMVDCWWGLVEGQAPQHYIWSGYRHLFNIVRNANLKLQVVMSFHQCGGNVGDDVNISIPQWVLDVGAENPDIFFTDRKGVRNPECLTWGVDKIRCLRGRTAVEVYYDYMRSFRQEMNEFFDDGTITEIEVGLGACGELRYPSYPERNGWRYPGTGEFQCYDRYLMESLRKAAEARGHSEWATGPENAGEYNSRPQDTDFFRDGGDYDSYYGRFFLKWYSDILLQHGDRVLRMANLAFEDVKIAAKVSGIHWWYKTASHAAELAAGFYNSAHRDGYSSIANMLAKYDATFNFTCVELRTTDQTEGHPEAMADPEGLVWQVLNAAWDAGISVASENALPCFDREGYNKILENAKPRTDPDGRHLVAFTYLRLNDQLMQKDNLKEFARFVKRLHGEPIES